MKESEEIMQALGVVIHFNVVEYLCGGIGHIFECTFLEQFSFEPAEK